MNSGVLMLLVKKLIKLNAMAAFYALVLLFQVQLATNVYRISRITNWPISRIKILFGTLNLSVFVISTIIFFYITKRYFSQGKLRFLLTLLWIPYYILFTSIFTLLFPIRVRGDEPVPVIGLLLIVVFFIYPFYIAIINLAASMYGEGT